MKKIYVFQFNYDDIDSGNFGGEQIIVIAENKEECDRKIAIFYDKKKIENFEYDSEITKEFGEQNKNELITIAMGLKMDSYAMLLIS